MKVLALCYVEACEWPLLVLRSLQEQVGKVELCAVVVRDHTVLSRLEAETDVPPTTIHYLPDHERCWLADPADVSAATGWPDAGLVDRIIRGDRHVGIAHVSGGVIPETPISRACQDPKAAEAYARGLLCWLRDVFAREKPDVVLGYLPEDAPSLAAALLAEERGLPFLYLASARHGDRFTFFTDAAAARPFFADAQPAAGDQHGARAALRGYRSNPRPPGYMAFNTSVTFRLPPLIDLAALAWRALTRRPPEVPSYPYPGARLWWELRRWAGARLAFALRRWWCDPPPDAARPWIFFPLQVDPEAGSIVAAPDHADQIATVRALAAALPDGWEIVVKEHVPMLGRRPLGYYRRLKSIPGVRVAAPDITARSLIEGARLTVVITGTAGMEAVLAGHKALFLGPTPLGTIVPNCHICHDTADLAGAMRRAIAQPGPSDDDLVRYLDTLMAHSMEIAPDRFFGGLQSVGRDVVTPFGAEMTRLVAALRTCIPALSAFEVSGEGQ